MTSLNERIRSGKYLSVLKIIQQMVVCVVCPALFSIPAGAANLVVPAGDVTALKGAITAANNEVINPGQDTIQISGTYTLDMVDNNTAGPNGLPSITSDIIIDGSGSAIIERDASAADFRILHVGAPAGDLKLDGVTVRGGQGTGGGGIANFGTLAVSKSTVSGNSSSGISNAGTLILDHSTVSGNNAPGSGGGGINNGLDATINASNCTISENTAATGGGISNGGGTVSLIDSTVSDNTADTTGGGIYNISGAAKPGTVIFINSTVSGNAAGFFGGGIFSIDSIINLTNTTINDNDAILGGGINNEQITRQATLTMLNTIVANSRSGDDCRQAGGAVTTSLGHNLDSDGTCGLSDPGDLPDTDPMLGPPQNNGGPTETHALLPGSPAIDSADNNSCPATDQRGEPRPVDGDSDGTAVCDIGAYEFQAAPVASVPALSEFGLALCFLLITGSGLLFTRRRESII